MENPRLHPAQAMTSGGKHPLDFLKTRNNLQQGKFMDMKDPKRWSNP